MSPSPRGLSFGAAFPARDTCTDVGSVTCRALARKTGGELTLIEPPGCSLTQYVTVGWQLTIGEFSGIISPQKSSSSWWIGWETPRIPPYARGKQQKRQDESACSETWQVPKMVSPKLWLSACIPHRISTGTFSLDVATGKLPPLCNWQGGEASNCWGESEHLRMSSPVLCPRYLWNRICALNLCGDCGHCQLPNLLLLNTSFFGRLQTFQKPKRMP